MDRDEEFRDFVRLRSPALLRIAFLLCGDGGLAEDLVQTTLLNVYKSWSKVVAADDSTAYVNRILINSFKRQRPWRLLAEQKRAQEGNSEQPSAARPPDERLADRDQLRRALDGLGRSQRAIVVLRFVEDLSVEQVAALMGISAGTVKSQTARALTHLRLSPQFDLRGER